MLKKLVKDLKPSSTLLINEISRKLEEQGKKIYKFGFGQSPFKVPDDIVKELKDNAHQNQYLSHVLELSLLQLTMTFFSRMIRKISNWELIF